MGDLSDADMRSKPTISIVLIITGLVIVALLLSFWLSERAAKPPSSALPALTTRHVQNGIVPAYVLHPSTIETNASDITVTLSAVLSGSLTRAGLDSLARRLSVEARKVNPAAAAFRICLYLSEHDRLGGDAAALVQFIYHHDGQHSIRFDEQRMAALGIPKTAPELLNENQRRTIFLTLVRAESFGDARNRETAAKAVAGRYGLKPEDLQPIRDEGQHKQWGGSHLSRSKEDTP